MYQVAWQTLEQDFGRPELVVNAQLKKIFSLGFIKPHDSADIIKFSQVVSRCVNVLSQYVYESDIAVESVLNSPARKLLIEIELKNKWLTYLQRYGKTYKNMRVFNAWLKKLAKGQENIRMQLDCPTRKLDLRSVVRKQNQLVLLLPLSQAVQPSCVL